MSYSRSTAFSPVLPTSSAGAQNSAQLASIKAAEYGTCRLPHPVAAVRTVRLISGTVVVAAGEATISVGSLSSWLSSGVSEGGRGGSFNEESQWLRTAAATPVVPPSSPQQLAGSSSSPSPSSSSSGAQFIHLSSGAVTSLSVVPLLRGNVALGCAGTSHGSVCVFAVEAAGSGLPVRISKIDEVRLGEMSSGLIGLTDTIVDVVVGFDPAARSEFVAAATRNAIAVVDVQRFSEAFKARATDAVLQAVGGSTNSDKNLPHLRRPVSAAFFCSFDCDVVRLLVPTRHHAAIDPNTALIVVQEDGVLSFIERHISGGAVQLLAAHHAIQQLERHDPLLAGEWTRSGGAQQRTNQTSSSSAEGSASSRVDPRQLPHITYSYALSPVTCDVTDVGDARGVQRANVIVNDAHLLIKADGGVDVVLGGVEMLPASSSAQPVTAAAAASGGANVSTPTTMASAASPTGGAGSPTSTWPSAAPFNGSGSSSSSPMMQTAGWWAIVRDIIPHIVDVATRQRNVVMSFTKPKLGSLPRDRRGLSLVKPLNGGGDGGEGLVLFASCNELHLGSVVESGVGLNALRHIQTMHSVIVDIATVEQRSLGLTDSAADNSSNNNNNNKSGGRTSAVLVASGTTLMLLQI